jgi:hypothetical protein
MLYLSLARVRSTSWSSGTFTRKGRMASLVGKNLAVPRVVHAAKEQRRNEHSRFFRLNPLVRLKN